jgi:type VII secretion integral membrane protein EccD
VATGTTVFSRVTVVAPRTRIDLALPSDVSVADLMPMLLDMAGENAREGSARHGGWCVTKLGGEVLDPRRTPASLGIVDGDLLALRRRSEVPPQPLYDDVVDAVAAATPSSYRPWSTQTSYRVGYFAGALALVLAAVAALQAGPVGHGASQGSRLAPAAAAGVLAIACVAVGATLARSYAAPVTGVVLAASGLPSAFVCGLYLVPVAGPSGLGGPNLLLATALLGILAAACVWLVQAGFTVFVAAGTAATLGFLAFLPATLSDYEAAGISAAAAAVALALLSLLPRLTIQLAKLPLPNVPNSAEDVADEHDFPEFGLIERRTGVAHEYMTGLIVGCGLVAAVAAIVAVGAGVFGIVLAAVVAAVLLLRARTYANGKQALALLATGMLAGVGMAARLVASSGSAGDFWALGVLVLVGALALLIGVVFPQRRFSPPLRRTVDLFEAVLIAAVLPLALAVMHLYGIVRHLNIGL